MKRLLPCLVLCIVIMQGCSLHSVFSSPHPVQDIEAAAVAPPAPVTAATTAAIQDSDNDMVPDGGDRCPCTPPDLGVDAEGCPLPERNPLRLEFAVNSSKPDEAFLPDMEHAARLLAANPRLGVLVEGHTDATGSEERNLALSEQRAAEVALRLQSDFGVDPSRIRSRGRGESHPVADNITPQGRAKNRRVELVIVDLGQAMVLAAARRAADPAQAQAPAASPAEAPRAAAETSAPPRAVAMGSLMLRLPPAAQAESAPPGDETGERAEAPAAVTARLESPVSGSLMLVLPEIAPLEEAAPLPDRIASRELVIRIPEMRPVIEALSFPSPQPDDAATGMFMLRLPEGAGVAEALSDAEL